MNNIALQSQQYATSVDQTVEPSRQALLQSMQGFVQTAQQAQQIRIQNQELQLRGRMTASTLALDQIRRRQAEEELRMAQQYHTVDMVANQKRLSTAQTDHEIVRLQKATEDLGMGEYKRNQQMLDLPDSTMARMIEMGSVADPATGKVRRATEAEREWAKGWRSQSSPAAIEDKRTQRVLEATRMRETSHDVAATRATSNEQVAAMHGQSAEDVAAMRAKSQESTTKANVAQRADTAMHKDRVNGLRILLEDLGSEYERVSKKPGRTPGERQMKEKTLRDLDGEIKQSREELRSLVQGDAGPKGEDDFHRMLQDAMKVISDEGGK